MYSQSVENGHTKIYLLSTARDVGSQQVAEDWKPDQLGLGL